MPVPAVTSLIGEESLGPGLQSLPMLKENSQDGIHEIEISSQNH